MDKKICGVNYRQDCADISSGNHFLDELKKSLLGDSKLIKLGSRMEEKERKLVYAVN